MPSETNLYHVLERLLKDSAEPRTCVDLYDDAEVRRLSTNVNRVSDALGNLWRRGYLYREPAPKTTASQAKWAYLWRPPERHKPKNGGEAQQRMTTAAFDTRPAPAVPTAVRGNVLSRPSLNISEEGDRILIELPNLLITIQTKDGARR